jgi:hypothetical protein
MNRNTMPMLAACAMFAAPVAAAQDNPMLPPKGGPMTSMVDAGQTIHYGPFVQMNPDCSLHGNATAKVTSRPRHGKAFVAQREGNVRYPPDSGYPQCNGRRVTGTMVVYVPNRGFRGEDRLKFIMIVPGGERRNYDFRLVVQ